MLSRLLAALLLAASAGCASDVPSSQPDQPEVVADEETPARATALLEANRPWSASRLMRAYGEGYNLSPEQRLLAAKAEAGWGDWERVLALTAAADRLDAEGRYLHARALDEMGKPEAAQAYRAFLSDSAAAPLQREAAALRLALLEGGSQLQEAAGDLGLPDAWAALFRAEALARKGDAAGADEAAASLGTSRTAAVQRRAWQVRIDAAEAQGDLERARALAAEARRTADRSKAHFAVESGRLALADGDEAAARAPLHAAIQADPAAPPAQAAARLLRTLPLSPGDHLLLARVDRALGLNARAADHFGQYLAAHPSDASTQYDYADALYYAEQYEETLAALESLQTDDARELRASALGRLGRAAEAAEIYLSLNREKSGQAAAPPLYFAADAYHQETDDEQARPLYRRVADEHAGTRWAGLATTRLAGMAFLAEDYAEAARLWDGQRAQGGDFALQATYWAGRAHEAAGDAAAARERYQRVRRLDRDSYYALLASEALGGSFWPIPLADEPAPDPAVADQIGALLRPADVLREAGFPEAASAAVDRAVRQGGRSREARLAMGEALVRRGYGDRAIQIGTNLGGGTSARTLRLLYPFPHRDLITAEAEDRGLDPFVTAALMRQESLFGERATSHVGARGLMQLMPATAQSLADSLGIEGWSPNLLYRPELNVHLGTAYVARNWERFEGSLPAVFGSYNAGPHQVARWQAFPEYGQEALFTERVPFRETRGYIKILTRNRALYQGLYGDGLE